MNDLRSIYLSMEELQFPYLAMYDNGNNNDTKVIQDYLSSKKIKSQFIHTVNTFSAMLLGKDKALLKLSNKFPNATFVLLFYAKNAMNQDFSYFLVHRGFHKRFEFTPDASLISKIKEAAMGVVNNLQYNFSKICSVHKQNHCYECHHEAVNDCPVDSTAVQLIYKADCFRKEALQTQIKAMGLLDLSHIFDNSDSSNDSDSSSDSDSSNDSEDSDSSSNSDSFDDDNKKPAALPSKKNQENKRRS
jgi:hypothetical protein